MQAEDDGRSPGKPTLGGEEILNALISQCSILRLLSNDAFSIKGGGGGHPNKEIPARAKGMQNEMNRSPPGFFCSANAA